MPRVKDKSKMYKFMLIILAGLGLPLATLAAFGSSDNVTQPKANNDIHINNNVGGNEQTNEDCLGGEALQADVCQEYEQDTGNNVKQVTISETHQLIQSCEVVAFDGSQLHLAEGTVVVSEMVPHDIIETVDYSGSHCPHTIKNLAL